MEYEHEFETRTEEKILAYGYGNIDFGMIGLKDHINTLTVTNMSWAPEIGHNQLSTILLASKSVEVFCRKANEPSEIIVNKKVFGLADKIENQYVIQLAKTPKPATVNQITAPTLKTWNARIWHLGYRSLLQLPNSYM